MNSANVVPSSPEMAPTTGALEDGARSVGAAPLVPTTALEPPPSQALEAAAAPSLLDEAVAAPASTEAPEAPASEALAPPAPAPAATEAAAEHVSVTAATTEMETDAEVVPEPSATATSTAAVMRPSQGMLVSSSAPRAITVCAVIWAAIAKGKVRRDGRIKRHYLQPGP